MRKLNFFCGRVLGLCSIVIVLSIVGLGCKKEDTVEPTIVTIDPTEQFQIIRGFGGATAFHPPNATLPDENDMAILFGNGEGQLGLSILRIRLATDQDPSWRATELQHALWAKSHDAIVVASPWSPPARMKTNSDLVGGYLITDSSANYANYLNDFAEYMANNGAELYAVSIQNEPDIPVTYESCDWTSSQMRDFLAGYGNLITNTKVMAAESYKFDQTFTDVILDNASASENVDIIGGHIYDDGLNYYANAVNKGKEVWMTEHFTDSQNSANDWPLALDVAKEIHDCMTIGQFNAYIWWYLKRYYGPLGEDGVVTKRGWIMANFAKFVRPGAHRVKAVSNGQNGIYVSAYQADKLIVVVVNMTVYKKNYNFSIDNASVTSAIPYTTSETKSLFDGNVIEITDNRFEYSLEPESITTFVVE